MPERIAERTRLGRQEGNAKGWHCPPIKVDFDSIRLQQGVLGLQGIGTFTLRIEPITAENIYGF